MNSERAVIVDTSIWIEYFNKPKSHHGEEVKKLLEKDRIVTCGIIIAELLQGAKNETEFNDLSDSLYSINFLEENADVWKKVGKLSFDLKREGKTLPLSDCLIAVLSIENNCFVYTIDSHFKNIHKLKFYA